MKCFFGFHKWMPLYVAVYGSQASFSHYSCDRCGIPDFQSRTKNLPKPLARYVYLENDNCVREISFRHGQKILTYK